MNHQHRRAVAAVKVMNLYAVRIEKSHLGEIAWGLRVIL